MLHPWARVGRRALALRAEPYWTAEEQHGLVTWCVVGGELTGTRFELPASTAGEAALRVLVCAGRFRNVDFSGLRFTQFGAAGSVFDHCSFDETVFISSVNLGHLHYRRNPRHPVEWSHALLPAARYPQTLYRSCTFRNTAFAPCNTTCGNTRFEDCVFSGLTTTPQCGLHTTPAEFVSCRFTGLVANVVFATKIGGPGAETPRRIGRSKCSILDNDFSGADLSEVEFRGVDLSRQHFPEGREYLVLERPADVLRLAASRVRAWDDSEEQRQALDYLRLLGLVNRRLHDGGQMLRRRTEFGDSLADGTRERLWDLLIELPGTYFPGAREGDPSRILTRE